MMYATHMYPTSVVGTYSPPSKGSLAAPKAPDGSCVKLKKRDEAAQREVGTGAMVEYYLRLLLMKRIEIL